MRLRRPSIRWQVRILVVGVAVITAAATTLVAAGLVASDQEATLFETTVERAARVRSELEQQVALTEAELRSVALASEGGMLLEVPRLVSGRIEALSCVRGDEELVRAAADPDAARRLEAAVVGATAAVEVVDDHHLLVRVERDDVRASALVDVGDVITAPPGWTVRLEAPSTTERSVVAQRRGEGDGERLEAFAPGTPSVRVDAPLAPARRAASRITERVLVYSLLAVVPLVLVGWVLARQLTRPILSLASAVRASGERPVVLPALREDEVGDLGHAIAGMSRRLFDDAEELRGAVDFARQVARLPDAESIRGALRAALEQAMPALRWHVLGPDDPSDGVGLDPAELEARFAAAGVDDSTRPPRPDASTNPAVDPKSAADRLVLSLYGARTCQAVVVGHGRLGDHERSIAQLLGRIAQSALRTIEVTRDAMESEKLAVLGRLAAGVTHEVNNPLSFVLTNIQLLESELDGDLKDAATDARQGVERVARIVRDLASLSRGGARLEIEQVALDQLAERAVRVVRSRRAEVTVKLRVVDAVSARCDAGRIEQILLNLLANAVDAAHGRPRPEVELRLVHDGAVARFVVRDNGTGIPPAVERRMFEPFFTTKHQEGTGLGLYVSRALARSHGGDITVLETGPRGTSIELTLPVVAVREVTLTNLTPLARRPRVLVVDDEPAIVNGLVRLLETRADVVGTSVPDEALDLVQASDFDLVLVDFHMPAMNGSELASRMRAMRPSLGARVRLMSGSSDLPTGEPVLSKPVTREKLDQLLPGPRPTLERSAAPARGV